MPSHELLTEMGSQRGTGEGRRDAGGRGASSQFQGRAREILGIETDGYQGAVHNEHSELIAGFWLWKVKSMEDAIIMAEAQPVQGPRKSKFGGV